MKKGILLFVLLLSFSFILSHAELIEISPEQLTFEVNSSNEFSTEMEMNFGSFKKISKNIDGEEYNLIFLGNESVLMEKGAPQLPRVSRSIIIPDRKKVKIEIIESEYTDFALQVAPSKGNFTRDINPEDVPWEFGESYEQNQFYPQVLALTSSPFILRDFRGITVTTQPFAYNHITKTLRVYHNLKLKLNYIDVIGENSFARTSNKINIFFDEVYRTKFLNYEYIMNNRYAQLDDRGRLIVICGNDFMDEIQPWINWKLQKGIPTELYSISEVGSSNTAIKNFIQAEYDLDNGLTFVQLVGDAAQVPSLSSGGGGSDPSYALLAGSDSYPDIFVGRFSGETSADIETQVERSIYYERDITEGAWLAKATGIASSQGGSSSDDGEADYVHQNVIRDKLLAYNYTEVDQIYDPSASVSDVATAVNEGRGLIDYIGHGSNTSWVTSGFSSTHVNLLTNDYMLPFINSVACVNGNFVGMTCFAEAWMRATNSSTGAPTGAIAIFASSINQSWSPPMCAQDEFIDLLCGSGPYAGQGNRFNTIGGLWYNSEGQMMDEYSSEDMYETWHIFGDATLQVRTAEPTSLAVNHDGTMFVGADSYQVSTGSEDVLVSLYDGENLVASGFSDVSGNVTLDISDPPTNPVTYTLTSTGYNRITNIQNVEVVFSDGPFLNIAGHQIQAGSDNIINVDEDVQLSLTVGNLGIDPATGVNVNISSSDSHISLTDNNQIVGSIAAESEVTLNNAFSFRTGSGIPHHHTITLQIGITSDQDNWDYTLNLEVSNPAAITIQPASISLTLETNSQATRSITLANNGGAELSYELQIIENESRTENSGRSYCEASGGCDEYISNFTMGDINNNSTCSEYYNYTNLSTNVIKGESYPVSLTVGSAWSSDKGAVYIDWNQDEDFDDEGETVINNWSGVGPYQGSITVPQYALSGSTRMRVRVGYSSIPPACGDTTYGEAEDYTLNIQSSGPDWVSFNGDHNISGSVDAGISDHQVDIDFDTTGLTDGTYSAQLVVNSNDESNPQEILPITLTVGQTAEPQPVFSIDQTEINISAIENGTETTNFHITNNGDVGSELTYSIQIEYPASPALRKQEKILRDKANIPKHEFIRLFGESAQYRSDSEIMQEISEITRDQSWLGIDPESGSCSSSTSSQIFVSVDTSTLSSGSYSANLIISHNAGASYTLPVNLTVTSSSIDPNVRNIAEFEPMSGALVSYPFGVPYTVMAEISEDDMLYTIVGSETQKNTVINNYTNNGVNLDNCEFIIKTTDTYWTRDYGPWFVENNGNIEIVDFEYNRTARTDDNEVPDFLADYFSVNTYDLGLTHTGGNYMTDGMGISISSDIAYTENSPMSEQEVDDVMQTQLGIDNYYVVSDPNDTYIDHVDCWGKFLAVDKLLIRSVPSSHADYQDLEDTVDYFESINSAYGTPYQIYRVYTPSDQPYTNSLILNDKVYVPLMNSSWDDDAIAVYEEAMPGYEVLGFTNSTSNSWQGTDALHCRVKEIADFGMLSIIHTPLPANFEPDRSIDIVAEITAYSGEAVYTNECKVYYRWDDSTLSSVTMSNTSGNIFSASIPGGMSGQTLSYYISASDASGRTETNPVMGEFNPHQTLVTGGLSSPLNVSISISGNNITLSWAEVSNAEGYKIYYSTKPDSGFTEVGSTISTTYTLENAVDTERYFFRVTAY